MLICLVLILATALVGCESSFRYADEIDNTVNNDAPVFPWELEQEFTYTEFGDSNGNVINFDDSFLSGIEIHDGKFYILQPLKPMIYDPVTNTQTYVCTDPLCDHKIGCPFSMTRMEEGIHAVKDFVVYFKGGSGKPQVAKYSRTDRTVTILRPITENVYTPDMVALEDCYYFIDVSYDEKTQLFTYSLCRQYYDSKEIEVLKSSHEYDYSILGADGDVIYYYDEIKKELVTYSATLRKELSAVKTSSSFDSMALCKDGYLIYRTTKGELMRVNTDGSGQRSLGVSGVHSFYLTDSYIYYLTVEDTVAAKGVQITSTGEKHYEFDLQIHAVYRTDHEGDNRELVWKNKEESNVTQLAEFVVVGNYLYSTFSNYYLEDGYYINAIELGQGASKTQYYQRIDCTTGEFYYIKLVK